MEAYSKLVSRHKNQRLAVLLEQTDEFLRKLGVALEVEKDAAKALGKKVRVFVCVLVCVCMLCIHVMCVCLCVMSQ